MWHAYCQWCPVWWTGLRWQETAVEKVQNAALRKICAVFRTTPCTALRIEAGLMPARQRLDLISTNTAIHFHKLDWRHPLRQQLPIPWRQDEAIYCPPPLPASRPRPRSTIAPPRTRLEALADRAEAYGERVIPFLRPPWQDNSLPQSMVERIQVANKSKDESKKEAAKAHKKWYRQQCKDKFSLFVYMDGSQMGEGDGRKTGAGIVVLHNAQRVGNKTIPMGAKAEVYDAEICVLAEGAALAVPIAMRMSPSVRRIVFCADNTSAIGAITSIDTHPGQRHSIHFCQSAQEFLEADVRNTVVVKWTPGHMGIEGNELTDEEAKAATEVWPDTEEGPTWSNMRRTAKEDAMREWKKDWKKSIPSGSFAAADQFEPSA